MSRRPIEPKGKKRYGWSHERDKLRVKRPGMVYVWDDSNVLAGYPFPNPFNSTALQSAALQFREFLAGAVLDKAFEDSNAVGITFGEFKEIWRVYKAQLLLREAVGTLGNIVSVMTGFDPGAKLLRTWEQLQPIGETGRGWLNGVPDKAEWPMAVRELGFMFCLVEGLRKTTEPEVKDEGGRIIKYEIKRGPELIQLIEDDWQLRALVVGDCITNPARTGFFDYLPTDVPNNATQWQFDAPDFGRWLQELENAQLAFTGDQCKLVRPFAVTAPFADIIDYREVIRWDEIKRLGEEPMRPVMPP